MGGPIGAEAVRLLGAMRAPGETRAIHLAEDAARAEALARFLAAAAPDAGIVHLPPWDCLPYDHASPSPAAMGRRMAALHDLAGDGPRLLVVAPGALVQRVPPSGATAPRRLRSGDALDAEALVEWALARGYRARDRVDEPGEIVLRGAVLDVFPAAAASPARLDLDGGAVSRIRLYDAATQRGREAVDTLRIDPATELPPGDEDDHEGAEHWLPDRRDDLGPVPGHLPGARLFATARALGAAAALLHGLPAIREERTNAEIERGSPARPLPPEALHLNEDEWTALRDDATVLALDGVGPPPAIATRAAPRRALARAAKEVRRTILVADAPRDRERLAAMLPRGLAPEPAKDWHAAAAVAEGGVALLAAPLEHGHRDADGTLVLSARDVLGQAAAAAARGTAAAMLPSAASDLEPGDLVVHEDEGLARFEGLEAIDGGEAIRLAFADDRRLLVPVAEAGLVWRHGHDEGAVSLDALGGGGWAKRRAALARALEASAAALVRGAREARGGGGPRPRPRSRRLRDRRRWLPVGGDAGSARGDRRRALGPRGGAADAPDPRGRRRLRQDRGGDPRGHRGRLGGGRRSPSWRRRRSSPSSTPAPSRAGWRARTSPSARCPGSRQRARRGGCARASPTGRCGSSWARTPC